MEMIYASHPINSGAEVFRMEDVAPVLVTMAGDKTPKTNIFHPVIYIQM